MAAQLLDTSKDRFDPACDAGLIVQQIGMGNLMAISGLRVLDSGHGVILPVAHGYKVTVDLEFGDTYCVRRILIRGFKAYLKSEMRGVGVEQLSEVARKAASYESDEFGEV
jgi:hypothetical protein